MILLRQSKEKIYRQCVENFEDCLQPKTSVGLVSPRLFYLTIETIEDVSSQPSREVYQVVARCYSIVGPLKSLMVVLVMREIDYLLHELGGGGEGMHKRLRKSTSSM